MSVTKQIGWPTLKGVANNPEHVGLHLKVGDQLIVGWNRGDLFTIQIEAFSLCGPSCNKFDWCETCKTKVRASFRGPVAFGITCLHQNKIHKILTMPCIINKVTEV